LADEAFGLKQKCSKIGKISHYGYGIKVVFN
jgi:hypothetical protein